MILYLDTSVYSAYYDEVHRKHTKKLFDLIVQEKIKIITSELVLDELKKCKDEKKRKVIDKVYHLIDIVSEEESTFNLIKSYLKAGVLSDKHIIDAAHIAVASLSEATAVVSNNMNHMVKRQNKFNMVNLRMLEKTITIYKPEFIVNSYEERKKSR